MPQHINDDVLQTFVTIATYDTIARKLCDRYGNVAPRMSVCSPSTRMAISPPATACWPRSPIPEARVCSSPSEQIGDGVAVAAHRVDMVGHAPAGHALVVVAAKGVVQRDMRDAHLFPEADFLAPVLFGACAG
jgi:hypothetical protein